MGNKDFKQEFMNKSDQCLNGSGILVVDGPKEGSKKLTYRVTRARA